MTSLELLGIHKNDLSGPIPPELGKLENLEWLDLDTNELSGPVPAELGRLENLEGMILHTNELSGSIPPELGQLAKLEDLRLHENMLSGPIPIELAQLSRLKVLWLNDNELTGEIPSDLAQLTRLEDLRFGGNQFSGCVPEELKEWAEEMPVCGEDTAVITELGGLPAASGLDPNYPNPFNGVTRITYRLADPGPVRLDVYNVLGQPVHTLVSEVQAAGVYQVSWDARDQRGAEAGTGVYLARLQYPRRGADEAVALPPVAAGGARQ